jgi:hypothetical protein
MMEEHAGIIFISAVSMDEPWRRGFPDTHFFSEARLDAMAVNGSSL